MASIFTDSWENIGRSLEPPGPRDSNTDELAHTEEKTDTTANSSTDAFAASNEMDRIPVMPMRKAAALSFTLMGAAFLNVSITNSSRMWQSMLTSDRHCQSKPW